MLSKNIVEVMDQEHPRMQVELNSFSSKTVTETTTVTVTKAVTETVTVNSYVRHSNSDCCL